MKEPVSTNLAYQLTLPPPTVPVVGLPVAYPEMVSGGGGSKSRKFKWLDNGEGRCQ